MKKKPIIYVKVYPNGIWAHNGQTGALNAKREIAIAEVIAKCPGDYDIVNVRPDRRGGN